MKDAQLEEDLQALAKAFLLLKTEEECIAFLKDVCTYQELRALSSGCMLQDCCGSSMYSMRLCRKRVQARRPLAV